MPKPNRFGSPYHPANDRPPPARVVRRVQERRETAQRVGWRNLTFTCTFPPMSGGFFIVDELEPIPGPHTNLDNTSVAREWGSRKLRRQRKEREQKEKRQLAARYNQEVW